LSSGSYNIAVSVSIDDQAYISMGDVSLMGNSPSLPINLPFTLASNNIITAEFPLDSLGEWNQIRVKLVHADTNASDDIVVLERSIITFALTLQDEA